MEQTILKSDIFFFVTTLAIVVITIGLAIGLVYLIKILRTMKRISERAEDTANLVADDIVDLRKSVKANKIFGLFGKKKRKK